MKALIFITSILISTSSIAGPFMGGGCGRVAIKSLQDKVLANHSEFLEHPAEVKNLSHGDTIIDNPSMKPVIGGGGGGIPFMRSVIGGGSSRTTDVYKELDMNESNSSARLAPQNLPQEDPAANRYKIKNNKLIIDLSKTNIEEIRTIHGDYLYLDTIRRELLK